MVGDNVFDDCFFRHSAGVSAGQAVFGIGLDGRHMDGLRLIGKILPVCIGPAVCAGHLLEGYGIRAGIIGSCDKAELNVDIAVSGCGGDKFTAGFHLVTGIVLHRLSCLLIHEGSLHCVTFSGLEVGVCDFVYDRDRTGRSSDLVPGLLVRSPGIDRREVNCLIFIRQVCMGSQRNIVQLYVFIAHDRLSGECRCVKCKLLFDGRAGGFDSLCCLGFHSLATRFNRSSSLFINEDAIDSDLLPDITLEILHIDSVGQYYTIFCGDVLLVPFTSQFCQDRRLLMVFNVPKRNDLHVRVDSKVILEHFHSLIVFTLDLHDVVIAVGEGPQGIIFLCVHAKPDAVSLFLLRKGSRALEDTVFICRKTVGFDLLAVAVKGSHDKGHACHALLAVTIDLADREIAAHDLVFNGVFFLCQVNDGTVLTDGERYGAGALDQVAFRCSCLDDLVVAVGE